MVLYKTNQGVLFNELDAHMFDICAYVNAISIM